MRLIPEPKQKQLTEGIFHVTEKTGISFENLEDYVAGNQVKETIFDELRLTVPLYPVTVSAAVMELSTASSTDSTAPRNTQSMYRSFRAVTVRKVSSVP